MRIFYRVLIISSVLIFVGHSSFAQDTVKIQEVEVKSNRSKVEFNQAARSISVISKEEIDNSPAKTLNELLEFSSNIDIKQRGQNGVQADLSLRGSSFEQVLILLNGVKMTDPQTGHHSLNLPLELLDIERIEILKGGASRIYGPGAFAGAINIITKNPKKSQGIIQALMGQYGLKKQAISASVVEKKHSHLISFSRQNSDGYIRNTDFQQRNVFWQSELTFKKSNWKLNAGQNEKSFGAQSFYTATFPDQFEEIASQFASIIGEVNQGKWSIEPKVYYRKHQDRFELFRESPSFYSRLAQGGFANNFGDTVSWYSGHNYTQTQVYGAEINVQYISKLGQTSLGMDFRKEEILSNGLGELLKKPIQVKNEDPTALYLRGAERENRSFYAEHNYLGEKLFVSIGAMYNLNTDFEDELFPGVDISYQITKKIRPFASVNRSFRFPTYTDLYYKLGGAKGSINLKPEESINYELGFKYSGNTQYAMISGFRREGKNLIDWIRYSGSMTTQAANLTEVNINGIEVEYVLQANSLLQKIPLLNKLRFAYAYLYSDNKSTGFESNYVLDFLNHKADLLTQFKIANHLFIDWNFSFQDRRGEFVNANGQSKFFKPVFISDLKASAQQKNLTLFIQVSNLFNQSYFDIGNVVNPGRWISLGMSYKFDFEKD